MPHCTKQGWYLGPWVRNVIVNLEDALMAQCSVWGPYRDAVFPNLWMNEGGQSSTGQVCILSYMTVDQG